MPATLARVALITQEYRWDTQVDLTTALKRLRARSLEVPSYASNATAAAAVNIGIFELLRGDAQLIEATVDPMPSALNFARLPPAATLVYEPLGISREVLIVGKKSEVRRDGVEKGVLLLW